MVTPGGSDIASLILPPSEPGSYRRPRFLSWKLTDATSLTVDALCFCSRESGVMLYVLDEDVMLRHRSGEFRLWFRVVCENILVLKSGRFPGRKEAAEDFLFNPENVFFDFIAGEMGYEDPEEFRLRIKKGIKDTFR